MKTKIDVDKLVSGVDDAFAAVKNPKKRGRPAKLGPKKPTSIAELIKAKASAHTKQIKKLNSKLKSHVATAVKKVKEVVKRNPAKEKDLWAVTTETENRGEKVVSTHRTKEVADSKLTKAHAIQKGQCFIRKVSGKHSRYEIDDRNDGDYVKLRNSVVGPVKNPKLGTKESVIDTLARDICEGHIKGVPVEKIVADFEKKHNFKCGKSLVDMASHVALNMITAKRSTLHNNPKKTQYVKTQQVKTQQVKTQQVKTQQVKRGGSFSELTKKR